MKSKYILVAITLVLVLSFTLALLPHRGGYADGRDHTPMDAPYTQRAER